MKYEGLVVGKPQPVYLANLIAVEGKKSAAVMAVQFERKGSVFEDVTQVIERQHHQQVAHFLLAAVTHELYPAFGKNPGVCIRNSSSISGMGRLPDA